MRSNPKLFESSFDRLAHAVIAVLGAENAGLQSDCTAASALVQNVAQTWPLLKHLLGRVTSHAAFLFLPNVRDETRAGERAVSPFELREMFSGAGPYEIRSLPARCLWQLDRLLRGSSLRGGHAPPINIA
jgi:hypothetical protein